MTQESGKTPPKWEVILEEIESQIRSGALPVGSRIPPEEELAQQYGVSRPTASRALNELAKHGYVTRRPKTGTIVAGVRPPVRHSVALIADRVAATFDFPQADFIRGVQEALGQEYGITLFDSQGSWHNELRHIRKAAATTDGIILYATCDPRSNSGLDAAVKSGTPLVLVDRVPEGEDLPAVLPDEVQATREVVELIISRGHSKIAFLSFDKPEVSSVRKRCSAYRQAMADHGLEAVERFLPRDLELDDKARPDFLRDVVFSLHKGQSGITAFFCVQDSIALGVLDSCEGMEVGCPSEVEVACFNEWPAMMLGRPWDIHRIVRRKHEMGRLAAEKLLAQISHSHPEPVSFVGADIFPAEPGPSPLSAVGMSSWIQNSNQRFSI